MAKTTHNSPLSLAYAGSLLELATEQNIADEIGRELASLQQLLAENRTFRLYMLDPGISHAERGATIKRIFGDNIPQLLRNFLGVLNDKNRLGELSGIADAYRTMLDDRSGKIEVDVTVAAQLSSEQLEEVRQRVSSALKKDAVVHQHVDESIIGGLILRVQDKLIDASVKSQLATMKEQLLSSSRK